MQCFLDTRALKQASHQSKTPTLSDDDDDDDDEPKLRSSQAESEFARALHGALYHILPVRLVRGLG